MEGLGLGGGAGFMNHDEDGDHTDPEALALRNTLSWILTENPRQFGLTVGQGDWIWVDELWNLPPSFFVKSRKYGGSGREQWSHEEILDCLKSQKRRYEVDCLDGRHRVRRVKSAKAEARAIAEQKRLAALAGPKGAKGALGKKKPQQGLGLGKSSYRPRQTHRVTSSGTVKEPPQRTEEERRARALKVHKAKRLLKNMGIDPYKLGLDLEETEVNITFTPYEDYHREQYNNGMIKNKEEDYEATFEEL